MFAHQVGSNQQVPTPYMRQTSSQLDCGSDLHLEHEKITLEVILCKYSRHPFFRESAILMNQIMATSDGHSAKFAI
jgi:hypothetical protein